MLEDVGIINGQGYALVRSYLEAHRDEIRAVDLDMAAFVAVTSIEALTHTAVLHRATCSRTTRWARSSTRPRA